MLTLTKTSDLLPALTDDFFKPWNDWFDNRLFRKYSVPAINIKENEDAFVIDIAAPGLKKADFLIEVSNGILTVSAGAEENTEEKTDGRYTRQEYSYASFSRSLSLPEHVNEDKITATYDGGVLKLNLPKITGTEHSNTKTIAIN